jgi:T4 RnlA family RNA ligase
MITPVLIDGDIIFKTKRSFTSAEANYANEKFCYKSNQYQFSKFMCKQGFTPIFELTSRANRIVCSYKEPALTLLAIRSNSSGEYFSRDALVRLADGWEIPYVKSFITEYEFSGLDWFKQSVVTDTNKEGYVFQFSNGQMVKMKTNWYMTLHHVVTFTTERNVAEMVVSEQVDDFKAYIASIDEPEMMETVNRVEKRVVTEINDIIVDVDEIIDLKEFDNPKDFAIKYRSHPLFYLLMNSFKGKENDWVDYFLKYRLKSYSTECI